MPKFKLVMDKIYTKDNFLVELEGWKLENQQVVFTNGVFDILHRGHIEYLAKAACYGDKFVVGINSDVSVKALNKGDNRPIQDEVSRALIIASLSFVDAVVIFNEATPLRLIKDILPNVLIKGGDYDTSIVDFEHPKYIVGSEIIKNNGGQVEVIQFVEGYSTSNIEEKIKRN